jgi:hypothetical protein
LGFGALQAILGVPEGGRKSLIQLAELGLTTDEFLDSGARLVAIEAGRLNGGTAQEARHKKNFDESHG